MTKLMEIKNVRGYIDENNVAWLNLEDVARGLGFTQIKNDKEYIRWETIKQYLIDLRFISEENSQLVGKDTFIPENIFYKLCMKAKNELARVFQDLVCDEILPTLRKTGKYEVKKELTKEEKDIKLLELESKKQEILLRQKELEERKANFIKEMSEKYSHLKGVSQVLDSKALEIVTGEKNLLPLPKLEEKTYSATEIAEKFTKELEIPISKNLIGKLANKYNLKVEEYSILFLDKALHSDKMVETYRYKECAFEVFRQALKEHFESKLTKEN